MKTFVPVSDAMLFESPEQIATPLVPYEVGVVCAEWLEVECIVLDANSIPAANEGGARHDA